MKFAELVPGAALHAGPRDVTEAEIIEFARRYDPQPFHVDRKWAAASRWGGLIASGWMTCSVAMEMAVELVLAGSESIASPGVEAIRWEHPVRPGDRLRLRVTVLSTRVGSSGELGILRWQWELHNQHEIRVLSLIATSFFELGPPAQ